MLKDIHSEVAPVVLRNIWNHRSFLLLLALKRAKASFSESRLSRLWWLLEPATKVFIYGAIFGLILSPDARPENFVVSLICGVAVFDMYTSATTLASNHLASSRNLVGSSSVSSHSLLASTVVEGQVKTAALPLIAVISALLFGIQPSWTWIFLAPLLAWMSIFLYGISLMVAGFTAMYPSFRRIVGAINRVIFYSSGIFWAVDKVLEPFPALLVIANLNPVYQFIEIFRFLLYADIGGVLQILPHNVACSGIVVLIGALIFKLGSRRTS